MNEGRFRDARKRNLNNKNDNSKHSEAQNNESVVEDDNGLGQLNQIYADHFDTQRPSQNQMIVKHHKISRENLKQN